MSEDALRGEPPNAVDLTEFREMGLVQEINRRILHPMGMALSVIMEEDGTISGFGPVYDYRGDPEGVAFAEGEISPEKAARVRGLLEEKRPVREKRWSFHIQPVPE